jgi:hypothetical protein
LSLVAIFIIWDLFFLSNSNDTNGLVEPHIYVYGALRLIFAISAYYYGVVLGIPLGDQGIMLILTGVLKMVWAVQALGIYQPRRRASWFVSRFGIQ